MKKDLILIFNCGSSSIKFAIIDMSSEENILQGLIQQIGSKDANLRWQKDNNKQQEDLPHINYGAALDKIIKIINDEKLIENILAIGHRVVHGGEYFTKSVIIDDTVLNAIRDCQDLAPLHNPAHILGIEAAQKAFPALKQAAVFDTAFHQTMPKHAYLYALPYNLYTDYKIRKYGFHGTSHRFVSQKAAEILNKPYHECKFITAHLGNGCSVCAIDRGKSIDTSMGLTPLAGLIMGTRSGDIDPSVHAYIADKAGYDIHKINTMLNKESGLLGISCLDSDMRTIEEAAINGNEQAILTIDMFCYRLVQYISAYAALLGQIDALIFTAGIGENSPYIRAKTIARLHFLNFQLNEQANASHGRQNRAIITVPNSTISMVIPTNEELLIAKDTLLLVS